MATNQRLRGATDDDLSCIIIVIGTLNHEQRRLVYTKKKKRILVRKRICWPRHADYLLHESEFRRYYRMSYVSFEALLRVVGPYLHIDYDQSVRRASGVPPVSPAGMLQCCISWLAGGSHHHIRVITGVSRAAFYRIVYRVMYAINDAKALCIQFPATPSEMALTADEFRQQSDNGIIEGWIGAIDGWLCPIRVPIKSECGRVTSFFSGHYQKYGLNVQACADHRSQFTSFTVNSPGGMNDSLASQRWHLSKFLTTIKGSYFVLGDNAYVQGQFLMTPFNKAQVQGQPERDSYNFYLSQLRIRVKMAFGLLVNKWRILKRPLCVSLRHCRIVISACMRLHNFCINHQLSKAELIRWVQSVQCSKKFKCGTTATTTTTTGVWSN